MQTIHHLEAVTDPSFIAGLPMAELVMFRDLARRTAQDHAVASSRAYAAGFQAAAEHAYDTSLAYRSLARTFTNAIVDRRYPPD